MDAVALPLCYTLYLFFTASLDIAKNTPSLRGFIAVHKTDHEIPAGHPELARKEHLEG